MKKFSNVCSTRILQGKLSSHQTFEKFFYQLPRQLRRFAGLTVER